MNLVDKKELFDIVDAYKIVENFEKNKKKLKYK